MRYAYECECGQREEVICSVDERTPTVPCSKCGKDAQRVLTECIIRAPRFNVIGRQSSSEYKYDPRWAMGNNGRKFGRTPEQQHRDYVRMFDTQRKLVEEKRRAGKEGDWEYLGGMPGEMHDAICDQEKDKNVVQRDPITFLKKNGLYMGKE